MTTSTQDQAADLRAQLVELAAERDARRQQRFVLRTLDELGRSLTAEESRSARAAIANAALRDRIAEAA